MTTAEMIKEFNDSTLIKIFEMPVKNVLTGEDDYIVWTVGVNCNYIGADASEDLKTENVRWDTIFTLDSHLETLHEQCFYAIDESDEWEHRDED
jgi:hypothetical protein